MKILLSGACGKMGQAIARIAKERKEEVIAGVDFASRELDFPVYKTFFEVKEKAEVIIDFSHPSVLPDLLNYAKINGIPAVLATTGYSSEEIETIKKTSSQVPIFFTFNMSLGINLLVDLAKKASEVLGENFDVEIIEKHHNLKQDAPSGTAIMLANAVSEKLNYQPEYIYDRHNIRRERHKKEIGFHSIRGGTIVGEHDVVFAGYDEVITLSHSAGSKEVFAAGAVSAAKFLAETAKKPKLYEMSDLIAENNK